MKGVGYILVVDDNEDDVYFMRRALKTAAPGAALKIASDGQSALDLLRNARGSLAGDSRELPSVVFLDLKLPYLHGLEVLAAIRADPAIQKLPVVILTSSSEENDRSRAEALAVQGYLVKPPTPEMLKSVFRQIDLWDTN